MAVMFALHKTVHYLARAAGKQPGTVQHSNLWWRRELGPIMQTIMVPLTLPFILMRCQTGSYSRPCSKHIRDSYKIPGAGFSHMLFSGAYACPAVCRVAEVPPLRVQRIRRVSSGTTAACPVGGGKPAVIQLVLSAASPISLRLSHCGTAIV